MARIGVDIPLRGYVDKKGNLYFRAFIESRILLDMTDSVVFVFTSLNPGLIRQIRAGNLEFEGTLRVEPRFRGPGPQHNNQEEGNDDES